MIGRRGLVYGRRVERTARGEKELCYDHQHLQGGKEGEYPSQSMLL
jgi:hypothetical protein